MNTLSAAFSPSVFFTRGALPWEFTVTCECYSSLQEKSVGACKERYPGYESREQFQLIV